MTRRVIRFAVLLPQFFARFHDACTFLDPNSVCLESGICSNHFGVTCDEAYIRSSANLLIPIPEPPIVPQPHHASTDLLVSLLLSRGEISIEPDNFHPIIWQYQQHVDCIAALTALSIDMYLDFPRIRYKPDILVDLVKSAEALARTSIVDPKYRSTLLHTTHMSIIRTYFRTIWETVNSLNRHDPLRIAIFGNLVPFIHAWLRVHAIFKLPSPFLGGEYLELVAEAAKFDPLYEQRPFEKQWVVPVLRPDTHPLSIPVVDTGNFPLSVLDFFDISESTNLDMNRILETFSAQFESLIETPDCDNTADYNRATLFFMHNHPSVLPEHKERFCDDTFAYWQISLIATTKSCFQRRLDIMQSVIELVHVCGREYFSVKFRAEYLLPIFMPTSSAVFQFDFRTSPVNYLRSISLIPINILRSQVRIVSDDNSYVNDPENEHIEFLSKFVTNITRPENFDPLVHLIHSGLYYSSLVDFVVAKSSLIGVGVAIGLLFREGDPNKVLNNIPNLYLDSVSVRIGFCKVVNCVGIEILFDQSEIPIVLDILRARKNVS